VSNEIAKTTKTIKKGNLTVLNKNRNKQVEYPPSRIKNSSLKFKRVKIMNLKFNLPIIAVFICALFLQGCTISQNVIPVESGKEISKIYVLKNDKVLMEGFHPELLKQLNELGFATETYSGDLPSSVRHYMNYTANWRWDLAMFLFYFKATLYEQSKESGFSKILGEVEYDARNGGGNMNKFGSTADKIRPLLKELLGKVKREPSKNDESINNNSVSRSSFVAKENNISEGKTIVAFTTKAVENPKTTSAIVINSKLIEKIQTALKADHYYHGNISGELNEDTRNAIAVYKEINNLSGKSIDKVFLNALGIE
jgi:hypothetical protein